MLAAADYLDISFEYLDSSMIAMSNSPDELIHPSEPTESGRVRMYVLTEEGRAELLKETRRSLFKILAED